MATKNHVAEKWCPREAQALRTGDKADAEMNTYSHPRDRGRLVYLGALGCLGCFTLSKSSWTLLFAIVSVRDTCICSYLPMTPEAADVGSEVGKRPQIDLVANVVQHSSRRQQSPHHHRRPEQRGLEATLDDPRLRNPTGSSNPGRSPTP